MTNLLDSKVGLTLKTKKNDGDAINYTSLPGLKSKTETPAPLMNQQSHVLKRGMLLGHIIDSLIILAVFVFFCKAWVISKIYESLL